MKKEKPVYLLCTINERNGEREYGDNFLMEVTENTQEELERKVWIEWRGDSWEDFLQGEKYEDIAEAWDNFLNESELINFENSEQYWSDSCLIQYPEIREIPEADFEILKKYLCVL